MELKMASVGWAFVYLGLMSFIIVMYLQWKWARDSERNIQILIARRDGKGKFELAPCVDGMVTLKMPGTNEVRVWMLNELATIETAYPGWAMLPKFMCKTIRLAVLNEGDIEPLLNRSPHRERIASPDVIAFLETLANDNPENAEAIRDYVSNLTTGPTREVVSNPAVLGAARSSDVLRALATVSNDILQTMKDMMGRLARVGNINPTILYGGLGLVIIVVIYAVYQIAQVAPIGQEVSDLSEKVDAIRNALGVR